MDFLAFTTPDNYFSPQLQEHHEFPQAPRQDSLWDSGFLDLGTIAFDRANFWVFRAKNSTSNGLSDPVSLNRLISVLAVR